MNIINSTIIKKESGMKKSIVFWIVLLFITGCSSRTQYVDEGYKNQEELITMGIDRGDFEKAAVEATESLLQSGVLNKQGGERYVVGIDQIINDTTQRIDTDMLIKKIRVALLRSGKAIVTTAIQVGGPEIFCVTVLSIAFFIPASIAAPFRRAVVPPIKIIPYIRCKLKNFV